MGLDHFFDKNLVFCLEADNQEQLFDQVATLLEEREIVTPTYREALITREKSFPTGLDMEFWVRICRMWLFLTQILFII